MVPLMDPSDPALVAPFLEPRHVALSIGMAAWCHEHLARLPEAHDDATARTHARQIVAAFGHGGLYGHVVDLNGSEGSEPVDLRACVLIREALARVSPLADAMFALQCLGSLPLVLSGAQALKDVWLPRIAAGQAIAAFAMTEREAGSDVSEIRTTARRMGDEYLIDGEKILISNAGLADVYTVFAKTDSSAGTRGISCFIVPADTPGLHYEGAQVLSSPHPLGGLRFDECRVPVTARLGDEGFGFALGMKALDRLRPSVAAAACGMAGRALTEAISYAPHRRQFKQRLSDMPIIREKLAKMAIDLSAARLLTYRAAWEHDLARPELTLTAAMAKAFATESAQLIIDQAIQIVGGRALLAEHPLDRLYRSVRALRIYEGATEIQQLIVARNLLRDVPRA